MWKKCWMGSSKLKWKSMKKEKLNGELSILYFYQYYTNTILKFTQVCVQFICVKHRFCKNNFPISILYKPLCKISLASFKFVQVFKFSLLRKILSKTLSIFVEKLYIFWSGIDLNKFDLIQKVSRVFCLSFSILLDVFWVSCNCSITMLVVSSFLYFFFLLCSLQSSVSGSCFCEKLTGAYFQILFLSSGLIFNMC